MSATNKRVSIATRASIEAVRASVTFNKGAVVAAGVKQRTQLLTGDVLGAPVGVNESKQNASDVDEKDYNEIAIMALATEFFNTNDINLELRTYLLENVIPTMMMALEKLLREVDARDMLNGDDALLNESMKEEGEDGAGSRAPTAISKDDDSKLCTDLEIQIDRPTKVPFNPINWLGQYLYRNNPRYIDPSDICNVPYFQQLRTVSQQTKARLFEFQLTQRAALRAEAMARKREKERLKKARTQQMEEMRSLFEQLLSTVFKKWTGKLWRIVNGSITKTEMLDAYRAILQSNSIQANDNMINKVSDLLKYLTMSPEVAESLRITNQQIQASSTDKDTTASTSELDPASNGGTANNESAGTGTAEPNTVTTTTEKQKPLFCLNPEYLSAEKWDQSTYVEATMTLTDNCQWTIDDLSTFLLALAAHIDSLGNKLISQFNAIYFAPRFSRVAGAAASFAPKDEWRHKLAKLVQEFDHHSSKSGNNAGVEALKGSLMDYCRGNVTLSQLGIPQSLLNDASQSQGQHELSIHPSTPERELIWLKGCAEAEEDYKKFMMVMCGLYGLEPTQEFFEFLKKKAKEEADLAEKDRLNALEKAKLEDSKVNAEEMQSRILKLQSLFLYFGEDAKPLTADDLNIGIDKIIAQMGTKLTSLVSNILGHFKYKGIKRELEKINVSPESFTDRLVDHLQIKEKEFDDLYKVLELVFETISGVVDDAQVARAVQATVLTANINRGEIQERALMEVSALSRRDDMAIAEFSESALHVLSRAIEQMHPEHRISGRISLVESGVTKMLTGESGAVEMIVERFLRIVAGTNDSKRELVGCMFGTGEQGFEAKAMAMGKPFQENDAHNDPIFPVKLMESRVAKYVGLPLVGCGKKPVGVMGLTLVGLEDGGYVPQDVEFLQTGATKIIDTIERIDAREKSVQIALASVQYIREKVGDTADISVFIAQPAQSSPDNIFRVLDRPYSPIVKDPRVMSAQSREATERDADVKNALAFARYMAGASGQSNLEKLADDAPEFPYITQSIKTKDNVNSTPTAAENGSIKTYIPVPDEEGKVFAVICLQNKNGGKGKVSDEDISEVKKISSILSNCGSVVKKEKFGDESVLQHLDGESIDEESRRTLLFPKMMLIAARNWLSKLDNKAISELKSYKKPPPAVLKVLKAVLYLFGKKPKEVTKWQDILKYVNMDLLKAMVSYDPTALQKKVRFRRCNKVLHSLSKTDVKKKTSIPTMIMFDWLIVSLDLRRRAVEARKRHPLVFNDSHSEVDAADSEVDGEGEEEEGVAGGGEIVEGTEEGETTPTASLG
ncbi:UNVERIFIED_CONTAM: EF-hand calcium-binding domain-containing protein 5 [Siphonaria sp. JEL0065]|nr:EF-hand calcium-binding domain-containing protein 5 [Siphonaria sp. JEL0065]